MIWQIHNIIFDSSLKLQNGEKICSLQAAYSDTGGTNPVMLVLHGFSSNTDLPSWWTKFDWNVLSQRYRIICINCLGSCHGALGPKDGASIVENNIYYTLTIRDTVEYVKSVLSHLGIDEIELMIGCSLGGMQALDFYLNQESFKISKIISVCGSPLRNSILLYNQAQIQLLKEMNMIGLEDVRKIAVKYARYFFRLSCTNDSALNILKNKIQRFSSEFESLNNYYTNDGSDYYSQFSLESYISIMSIINSFKINFQNALSTSCNRKLLLVGISSDSFTPLEDVESLSASLISGMKHGF